MWHSEIMFSYFNDSLGHSNAAHQYRLILYASTRDCGRDVSGLRCRNAANGRNCPKWSVSRSALGEKTMKRMDLRTLEDLQQQQNTQETSQPPQFTAATSTRETEKIKGVWSQETKRAGAGRKVDVTVNRRETKMMMMAIYIAWIHMCALRPASVAEATIMRVVFVIKLDTPR